jgi:hypothetical protein
MMLQRKGTKTYRINHLRVSFHTDWVTYGIPIVEYEVVASLIRQGNTNRALERLDTFLDLAAYDAKQRRPSLSGNSREQLDTALIKMVYYRQRYPRPIASHLVQNTNQGSIPKRQMEVDDFLQEVVSEARK